MYQIDAQLVEGEGEEKAGGDSQMLTTGEALPTPGTAWREKGGLSGGLSSRKTTQSGSRKPAPRPTLLLFAAGTHESHQRAWERRPGKCMALTWRRTSALQSQQSKVCVCVTASIHIRLFSTDRSQRSCRFSSRPPQ